MCDLQIIRLFSVGFNGYVSTQALFIYGFVAREIHSASGLSNGYFNVRLLIFS